MILKWRNATFEYPHAVREESAVIFYDASYKKVNSITGITAKEWKHISIQNGSWTDSYEIPTETDHLIADLDYLEMENEQLSEENEVLRADLDYCLMILESV